MQLAQSITVGLLRPPEVALSEFFRDALEDGGDRQSEHDRGKIDDRIDEIRSLFEEATERLGVILELTEYQLHVDERGISLPPRKRAKLIHDNSILVAVDPSPYEHHFVSSISSDHPLRRSVVAYTNKDTVIDTASLNATKRVPLVRVEAGRQECVHRIYILHLPLNDDDLADHHQKNICIVQAAVRYPYGLTTLMSVPSNQLVQVSDTDPLSTEDGQCFIRALEKE